MSCHLLDLEQVAEARGCLQWAVSGVLCDPGTENRDGACASCDGHRAAGSSFLSAPERNDHMGWVTPCRLRWWRPSLWRVLNESGRKCLVLIFSFFPPIRDIFSCLLLL